MARDTGGHLSGLTRWRRGGVGGWVAWVAEAITRSAEQVVGLGRRSLVGAPQRPTDLLPSNAAIDDCRTTAGERVREWQ